MSMGTPLASRGSQSGHAVARGLSSPGLARALHRYNVSASSSSLLRVDAPVIEADRVVSASASRHASEAVQLIDSVVKQQQPHDSLLKSASESFWDNVDAVANGSGPAAIKSVASAVADIPDIPLALKASLANLSTAVSSAVASSGVVPDFAPVRAALDASWRALRSSNFVPTPPQLPGVPTLPSLPDIPSLDELQASALSDLSQTSLFNGTYTEQQVVAIVAAIIAVAAVSTATARATQPATTASDAELPTEYDSDAILRYWSTRPVKLFKRSIETAWLASGFLVGLQLDKLFGEQKKNEKVRARMLREAVDRLGPAYIKVAQALSTRVDLLSPAYFEEITLLQDRVAAFPTDQAMEIMEAELGGKASRFFSKITPAPVAAASLGQVYRATLKDSGEEVAIKVQRPGVLELVALDLVLGRRGIQIAGQLFPAVTNAKDILPVLDEWAFKFYREMDYRKEGAMMARFADDLAPLSGIRVPQAYDRLTTRRVLVTEWIDGEKLSESNAEDVKELCTTLLNAYLIQLLDTGLLHADPHPGNLIRTPDGQICILDFGLVTEVPKKFRVFILEYMAHLSLKDWAAIGDDFVKLQFVTEDSLHPNEVPGLMDSVGVILELLMTGGGMSSLDKVKSKELVDMVGLDPGELEEAGFMDGFASVLTNLSNPNDVKSSSESLADRQRRQKIRKLNEQVKFRLPPYFVLILRAFSVIEGIALKVDPKYSIISETFPYLSRRLLTDDNAEVRRALRQVLYGDRKRMDLSRFSTLFESLQSFTTDGLKNNTAAANTVTSSAATRAATAVTSGDRSAPAASTSAAAATTPTTAEPQRQVLDKNTLLALQSVLSASGTSYIQQLLVSELAATVESLSRSAAVALLQRALQSSLTTATLAFLDRLGPVRQLVFPFPLPVELIRDFGGVMTLTEDDEIAISNVQTVWSLLQPQLTSSVGSGNLRMSLLRSFAGTVGELPNETRGQLLAGAGRTSQMLLEKVVQRTAARFAEDVANVRAQHGAIDGVLGRDDSDRVAGAGANRMPVPVAAAQSEEARR